MVSGLSLLEIMKKKMRRSKSLLIGINLLLVIAGIVVLYLSSLLWMGSKEDYEDLVSNSYWSFFANRLLFNILIGLVIVLIVGLITWLAQKIIKVKMNISKMLAVDFLVFITCSIVFIAFQLS